MRHHARNCCLGVMLVVASAEADQQIFAFPVPDGFVSLKGNATAAPTPDIDDSLVHEAQDFDAYAVHVGPDGVDATYTAKVFSGTVPLANLPEFTAKAVESNPALQGARILSTRIVDVAGVRSGRIELKNVFEGVQWHQVLFLLPARRHWAVVKLAAHEDRYEPVSGEVEAVIPLIRGVASPSGLGAASGSAVTPADEAQGRLGWTLVVGGLSGYFLNRILRRRKPVRRGASRR